MMRKSTLPSIRVPKVLGPVPKVNTLCVGCGNTVNPGFCHTGSVLVGTAIHEKVGETITPVLGTGMIETYDTGTMEVRAIVIGGESIPTMKKVSFPVRRKGYICDSCAGNYKYHKGQPIVKTDPRPGTMGETKADEPMVKRSNTTLRGTWNPPKR